MTILKQDPFVSSMIFVGFYLINKLVNFSSMGYLYQLILEISTTQNSMPRLGLASFDRSRQTAQQFNDLGSSLNQNRFKELANQLESFQSTLVHFATEHRDEIRGNPEFRTKFVSMCHTIGVDPLATSATDKQGGSFWASLLGRDVIDYYLELAVRVVEVCRSTRDKNGGLMDLKDIARLLSAKGVKISEQDVIDAIESLSPLGGIDIIEVGSKKRKFVRSVPIQLSNDQGTVLEACQALGYVSSTILKDNFAWNRARTSSVLEDLVSGGLVWIDLQDTEPLYWLPDMIMKQSDLLL